MDSGNRLPLSKRGELTRRSDRVEAWAHLILGVLTMIAVVGAGTAAGWHVHDSLLEQRAGLTRVPAVVLEDAGPAVPVAQDGSANRRVDTEVRWTAPDGTVYREEARVPVGTTAGTATTIWIDEHGPVTGDPAHPSEAAAKGVLVGIAAAGGAGLGMLAARSAVRAHVERMRQAEWDREWARVGPQWSRR